MKKIVVLVLILIVVTGCQNTDDVGVNEKSEHKENVVFANHIEGNAYSNDIVGIQMTLSEDFEIYNYEELNLPDENTEMGNILLYASLSNSNSSNSNSIFVIESLYEGDDYKDNLLEGVEDFDAGSGISTSVNEEQINISDEDVLLIKVEQDFGENRLAYTNYYFIHHRDSLITIMLAYDHVKNSELPKELLSWIELY